MFPHPLVESELARQRQADLRRSGGGFHRFSRRGAQADGVAPDLGWLIKQARDGDGQAWKTLIDLFTPALRATARGYGLAAADVEDVVQTAWMSAFKHLGSLREPEAVGGWMKVITRREALRVVEQRRLEVLSEDPYGPAATDYATPESALVDASQRDAVRAAVDDLPSRQRGLIKALFDHSEPSYDEIRARLGMPTGSIGPTRKRALARLRHDRRLAEEFAP
jgi:RNA polymerase sigma factor (sigma-70 family)